MSNSLAIAAATATLRNRLLSAVPLRDPTLADLEVTTQPPDLARKGVTKAQLNLFLYQTVVNAAWRNMPPPRQARPGEAAAPPLALNLHYLVTAFGRGESDNDSVSHRVLGGAMGVLHDHAVLDPDDITAALSGNDLATQVERLRVTALPLSLEEMSKLWSAFQSPYRLSAAYEVTVVLIDSRHPVRANPPVLRRGPADRGPATVGSAGPVLREARPPLCQPAVRLGERLEILGDALPASAAVLRFDGPVLPAPVTLAPAPGGTAAELSVLLPDIAADPDAHTRWRPGFHTVELVAAPPGLPVTVSNRLAVALAPRITVAPLAAVPGAFTLTVTCAPRLGGGQRALLVFGDRLVEPATVATPADKSQPTTLTFDLTDVPAGTHLVRLRVDGVDSIPVVQVGDPPLPAFDPAQRVEVS